MKILGVAGSRTRGSVTPVTKEVDICVGDFLFLRGLKESLEMMDVRVDTAVRNLQDNRLECFMYAGMLFAYEAK